MSALSELIKQGKLEKEERINKQAQARRDKMDFERERCVEAVMNWIAKIPEDCIAEFNTLLQDPVVELKGEMVTLTWTAQSEALRLAPIGVRVFGGPERRPTIETMVAFGPGWQTAKSAIAILVEAAEVYDQWVEAMRQQTIKKLIDEIDAATVDERERVHTVYESLLQFDAKLAHERLTRYNERVNSVLEKRAKEALEADERSELETKRAAEIERYRNAYREWAILSHAIIAENTAKVEAYKKNVRPVWVTDIIIGVSDGQGVVASERHTTLGKHASGAWRVVNGCSVEQWHYKNVMGQSEPYLVEPTDVPPFYSVWLRLENTGIATHVNVLAGTKREQVEQEITALCTMIPEQPKFDSNLINWNVAHGIRNEVENELNPHRPMDDDSPF